MDGMKSYLLLTANGAVLVLAKKDSLEDPQLLQKVAAGLDKFEAHEIQPEEVKKKYRAHYEHVLSDPKQSDSIIVLDDKGEQIFRNISFKSLGPPIYYESGSFAS